MKRTRKSVSPNRVLLAYFLTSVALGIRSASADYPGLILSNNPVAYYRLEEVSGGTAFDSTTNHFDAIYVPNSDSSYPQLGLPGITTNSVGFNGGSDFGSITIPYHPELSPSTNGTNGAPFSVECWVQANTHPSDYSVPLAMFGSYSDPAPFNNASGWNFYQSGPPSGGTTFWVFNLKNGAFLTASGVPITLIQWYHLAATFDGSTAIFYVNGVSQGSLGGITGYLADYQKDGQVGAGVRVGFLPFNGGVDEIAFYTNVLSAANILAHYQLGTNSFRAVPTPPGFLQQPASRTNFAGTVATFSVVANGTAPLSYQWKRGITAIPGATGSAYSLTCAYPADNNATFSVTVTNSVGTTNSAVATLTVSTNLNLLYQPFSITRYVGSKAAFRVVANGAVPITYQWYKVASGATNPIPGATGSTLWLNHVALADDQSSYFAHVTGPFTAADSDQALLTVQARPVNVPITGYARGVVADDPVAYWRLDETTGAATAIDAVGSFDGAYDSSLGPINYGITPGIPNETNKAIAVVDTNTVPGQGGVVRIPYALELNPYGPWTVEAWVRPDSNGSDFRTVLSSMYNFNFSTALYGWIIYQHPASAWTLSVFNGTGGPGFFGSDFGHIPLALGSWYYLVLVNDGTTIQLYVNAVAGSAQTTVSGSGFVPNGINGDPAFSAGAEVLGQRSDGAFLGFDGGVDDVAYYNYPLSPTQIQLHYQNTTKLTIDRTGANVVVTWPLGTLQSAPSVTGTYTNVPGAVSPFTDAPSATQKYYRVLVQP